jgi:transcriptional regulator with XRE-family HTH domain
MLTHKQLRAQALKQPEVAAEFEKQIEEFALLDEFLRARSEQGLTQAEVAERIGTTQSAVARMESGRGKHSPSLATLSKYAEALGCKLEVRLVRKRPGTRNLTSQSRRTPRSTRALRAR